MGCVELDWLLVGLGASGVVTVLVGVVFVAGTRLFPTRASPHGAYSGEGKRRTEIREYLSAIGERYAEDHVVEGQRVEFYLPERDVAVTFDARAYFRIDGSPTRPVLVEHELPGASLGGRLPFETPELTGATADTTRAAFEALGLPTTADAGAIKRAYREKIKEAHPDHGGDRAAFQRIREAYTTAKEAADQSESGPATS